MPPVSVSCVQQFRAGFACQRDGDKLAIVTVELAETRIPGELRESAVVMDGYRHDAAMLWVGLILPKSLEECVAHAGLPGMAEIPAVFFDDQPLVVQKGPALRLYLSQRSNTGGHALPAGLFGLAIGD